MKLEVLGFAEAQTGDTQQSEQAIVDPWAQRPAFIAIWHLESGIQESTNFHIRVQIRSRAFRPSGQQALRWNLRAWIGRAAILRKSSNEAQSLSPMRRLGVQWLLRPIES